MGRLPFVLGISAAVVTSLCTVSHAAARSMQASDFQRIVGLSAPAISPDGKRAVVVVSRIVWNDDKETSDLDLIDVATHERRTISHDRNDLDAPASSPDASKLAFIADAGEGDDAQPQV